MRIVIDGRWIFEEISGIGHYTRELLRHLSRLDRANEYLVLFCNPEVARRTWQEADLGGMPNVRAVLVGYGLFSLRNQLALPLLLRREAIDVYHAPNYMIPFLAFPPRRPGRIRSVVTIHDVIPLLFPDHAPRSRKSRVFPLYRWVMQQVGQRADAVITVSEQSRQDTIGQLRIGRMQQSWVRSIHNGVSEGFFPAPDQSNDRPHTRGILYVGRADPYKNLSGLVRAFAGLKTLCPFPVELRVAGSPDQRYPEPAALARELGMADDIRWLGYLSDEELREAYQQADVLAHPSLYEGFGLQVLEAMACGTPVVCSDRGSLPEVAGDAALLVDPEDTDSLAQALLVVLTQPQVAKDLVERGLDRAAEFTWERTARQTLAVFHEVHEKE